jgi:hypothetical protein
VQGGKTAGCKDKSSDHVGCLGFFFLFVSESLTPNTAADNDLLVILGQLFELHLIVLITYNF